MKKTVIFLVVLLTVTFLISTWFSLGFVVSLNQVWTSGLPRSPSHLTDPSFAAVFPFEKDDYRDVLLQNLVDNAKELDVPLDVQRYRTVGNSVFDVLDRLTLSRVLGLILYAPDTVDLTNAINQAEVRGIPVFLVDIDFPRSRRHSFIGSNAYQVGSELARFVPQKSHLRIGVVLNQSVSPIQALRNSLFINGLTENFSPSQKLSSLEVRTTLPVRFAAEELVWSMLHEDPPFNVLITTEAKDSLSAFQTIVEANRARKIHFIALGEDLELQNALKLGVVDGLVVRDPVLLGQKVIETAKAYLRGEAISSYIHVPMKGLSSPEVPTDDF